MDDVVVLDLCGRVSVREPQLKRLIEELAAEGGRYFIINLGEVSYLDNAGLGQLCYTYSLAQRKGGDMLLLNPTSRIDTLLRLTKLDSVFETFASETDAIASISVLTEAVSA
jgi:anti-sigma B factor antagonist